MRRAGTSIESLTVEEKADPFKDRATSSAAGLRGKTEVPAEEVVPELAVGVMVVGKRPEVADAFISGP
jgi:hypothetical protein